MNKHRCARFVSLVLGAVLVAGLSPGIARGDVFATGIVVSTGKAKNIVKNATDAKITIQGKFTLPPGAALNLGNPNFAASLQSVLNEGEGVYKDNDNNGRVSAGDTRLLVPGFAAGAVAAGDPDVGTALKPFSADAGNADAPNREKHTGGAFAASEGIYRDLNNPAGKMVSAGDVRLVPVVVGAVRHDAGSPVAAAQGDVNRNLADFAAAEQHTDEIKDVVLVGVNPVVVVRFNAAAGELVKDVGSVRILKPRPGSNGPRGVLVQTDRRDRPKVSLQITRRDVNRNEFEFRLVVEFATILQAPANDQVPANNLALLTTRFTVDGVTVRIKGFWKRQAAANTETFQELTP